MAYGRLGTLTYSWSVSLCVCACIVGSVGIVGGTTLDGVFGSNRAIFVFSSRRFDGKIESCCWKRRMRERHCYEAGLG